MINENNKSKRRPLTPASKYRLVPKKGKCVQKMYPDEYYKSYWSKKRIDDGIYLVSLKKHITNKQGASELIEQGFRYYMEQKTWQRIKNEVVLEKLGQEPKLDRFVVYFAVLLKPKVSIITVFRF